MVAASAKSPPDWSSAKKLRLCSASFYEHQLEMVKNTTMFSIVVAIAKVEAMSEV